MNPVLEEILRSGYTTSASGQLVRARYGVGPDEVKFLQELISELRPRVSLEIGLAYGVSALCICDAMEKVAGSRHIVIDPYQRREDGYKGIGLHNLTRAGYGEMVEFFEQLSHRALPQLEAQGRKIDFAFIDGWHTFDYTMIDFFYIDKMLNVGGIVVLDDANWVSIRKLCRYIVTNLPYSVRCMRRTGRPRLSLKRSVFNSVLHWMRRVPRFDARLRRVLQPEIVQTDFQLGLWGSCIAFKKISEDARSPEFHAVF